MIELDVAVIGAGFSGCAVAAQLARRAREPFALALFDPAELGRGAAYGTRHDAHLLNTLANVMSIYPDEPDHFVRWLGTRGGPTDFVSRRLYGSYVGEIARQALERSGFTFVPDRVRAAWASERGGFLIESEGGARFHAATVVLATGNPLPSHDALPREALEHPGYVGDPWRFDYRVVGGHVLLVGSGLTALDVLVALDVCGHRGRVDIVSRHGRYPQIHADVVPYDVIPALDASGTLALLRSFRRHVAHARRRGFDWRSVVDAIRPEAEATWRRLRQPEQRRFERHLRRRWERHRHRAPAQVSDARERYERSGRLVHHVGRLVEVTDGDAVIRLQTAEETIVHADWIVNCSGVGGADAMVREPVLRGMLADGLISMEPQRFGFRAGRDFEAIASDGSPTPGLWILGPPVRGSRFEATAVPEIRGMAREVALSVLRAAEPRARLA